jgi:hypothetical protein
MERVAGKVKKCKDKSWFWMFGHKGEETMKTPFVFALANQTWFVFVFLSAILLGIVLTTPARADVVYTNFGPGVCGGDATCISDNGINQNDEPVFGETQTEIPGDLVTQSLASAFIAGGNFTLTDVKLPLDAGVGDADVYLMTNSGGAPGTVLESWTTAGQALALFPANQTDALTLTASGPAVTLSSGDEYWLVATPAASTSGLFWNPVWPTVTATLTSTLVNATPNGSGIPPITGPWSSQPLAEYGAFEIDGTPVTGGGGPPPPTVPEPSMFWLLGAGFVGVARFRRKYTKGQ